jgi:predicted nucleic acid-binding protein
METIRAVIGTDVLIDPLRNVKKVVVFLAEIEESGSLLSTTVINAFELYHGAHGSKEREQNLLATRGLLNRLILLPLGPRFAETAGRICAQLDTKGQPIGLRDAFIGAITLTKGYMLASRNAEHFRKITGLTITTAPKLKPHHLLSLSHHQERRTRTART